jgi:HEAT repeat protein
MRGAGVKRGMALVVVVALTACGTDNGTRSDERAVAGVQCDEGPALGEVFALWQLLSHHELRLSARDLRAASGDPVAGLTYLYGREDIARSVRLRAVDAVSFVPDSQARSFLKDLMGSESPDEDARHRALVGFARAFPDDAKVEVGTVLALDADPQIRLSAAKALVEYCGEDGRILVLQAADAETEGWVKEKMLGYASDPMKLKGDRAPVFP